MWRPMQRTALVVTALGTLWLSVGTSGQSTPASSTSNGEWPHYTGDLRGTKYSPLDQINASKFNKLEIAWRFKTDSLGTRPEYKLEGTPLVVGGVLYATGGTRRASDSKQGEIPLAGSQSVALAGCEKQEMPSAVSVPKQARERGTSQTISRIRAACA